MMKSYVSYALYVLYCKNTVSAIVLGLACLLAVTGCNPVDAVRTGPQPAAATPVDDCFELEVAPAEHKGELWCGEHDVAERECGICQPHLLGGLSPGEGLKVRVPSGDGILLAGVGTGAPSDGAAASGADLLGRIAFDRNRLAAVTPLGAGVLREVMVDVGDRVEAGQPLASVASPSLAEACSAYVKALAETELNRRAHAREQDLHAREISARQDLEQAQAALAASQSEAARARQHLLDLGLTVEEADAVARGAAMTSTLAVRAPLTGTVTVRDAVAGMAVDTGTRLFEVADLDSVWMELAVPERMLGVVQPGAAVQARFDAFPGLVFEGEVTQVGYRVDERTRMVEARAVLPNGQGLLRAGMFGRARIAGAAGTAGLTLPRDAVQVVDGRSVVFARLEADLFEVRPVELGAVQGDRVAVLAGVGPRDEVVTGGSYLLKSEFLRGRFGAGCADH
jgi:cobalt-zinc-cadmium efflux system membrane fusion protein